MDVSFWHRTNIVDEMSFLFPIWPTSSLTVIVTVSVLAVSFVVVLAAQVCVSLYTFFTNYHLFLPHNYTIIIIINMAYTPRI